MAIQGVLLDIDNVVLAGNDRPSEEWNALHEGLRARRFHIGLMTSESVAIATARLARGGVDYDSLHSVHQTGKQKPGGSLVEAFCRAHDLAPNETLVLGKDERSVLEALNGRAMAFHACGAGASNYGIPVSDARQFFEYVDIFFRKDHLWYARYDGTDGVGRAVHVRALIDGNGAGSPTLKRLLYQTLKERAEPLYAGVSLSRFLMMHLVASAYLDGFLSLDRKQVYWQIYPGHSPSSADPPVIAAIVRGFALFRSKMAGLKRLAAAQRSHTSRMAGDAAKIDLANQLRTLVVDRSPNVAGRRVFVLDDFTTEGYSHEAARTLFYAAGASEVFSFAVGKYGSRYRVFSPRSAKARALKPSIGSRLTDDDFEQRLITLEVDPEALDEFRRSAEAMRHASIADNLYPP